MFVVIGLELGRFREGCVRGEGFPGGGVRAESGVRIDGLVPLVDDGGGDPD